MDAARLSSHCRRPVQGPGPQASYSSPVMNRRPRQAAKQRATCASEDWRTVFRAAQTVSGEDPTAQNVAETRMRRKVEMIGKSHSFTTSLPVRPSFELYVTLISPSTVCPSSLHAIPRLRSNKSAQEQASEHNQRPHPLYVCMYVLLCLPLPAPLRGLLIPTN